MTAGERVREVRNAANLSMEKFGAKVGVGKTAISKIEHGENALTDQMAKSICREFGVSETWLRTGDGPMIEPVNEDEELYLQVSKLFHYRPESFRRRLFNMLNAMPDELLDRLEEYAVRYLLASGQTKTADGEPSAVDDTPQKEV